MFFLQMEKLKHYEISDLAKDTEQTNDRTRNNTV